MGPFRLHRGPPKETMALIGFRDPVILTALVSRELLYLRVLVERDGEKLSTRKMTATCIILTIWRVSTFRSLMDPGHGLEEGKRLMNSRLGVKGSCIRWRPHILYLVTI